MPATSLNPVATVAPLAASGTASAPRGGEVRAPDAAASADGDFGSALKRQVNKQSDERPHDATEARPDSAKPADKAAAATPASSDAPADAPANTALAPRGLALAQLIGATASRVDTEGRPAARARDEDDTSATEAPPTALASLFTPQTEPRVAAPAGLDTADSGGNRPAKDAASLPAFAADPRPLASESSPADALRAPAGPDAVAANSFASLHAAALAQIRGEAPAPASNALSLPVHTPATHAGWPEEVSNRVSWMVGQHESQAELTLTPPQLGKVEVTVTVSGDQTSAQFVAATPAARDLIEQALPRLRELLGDAGIALGQTSVGTSGQPGAGDNGDGARRGPSGRSSRSADSISGVTTGTAGTWLRRGEGMVDTFA